MMDIKYAYWRTDKPKDNGYSHELISYETEPLLGKSDLETLDFEPFEGVNTVLKAIRRTVQRIPENNFLGTRDGAEYKWTSWKDAYATAEAISHGVMLMNLAPEVEGEEDG